MTMAEEILLILASESASRRTMLEAAGVPHEAVPAHLDEAAIKQKMAGRPVEEVALALAEGKALKVSKLRPDAYVVGSDSMLALSETVTLDKPGTLAGLKAQLLQLNGRAHRLVSAVAVARDDQILWRHVEHARLQVRGFSDTWLDEYIARDGEELLSSVGGYHLEARGVQLFDAVDGDQFVVRGLPLLALLRWLRETGVMLA